MYLQNSFSKILKTTPTAYIAYETIKDSQGHLDYKVLDYNPSFIKLISEDPNTSDRAYIKDFIYNIKDDIPQVGNYISDDINKRISGYIKAYEKWLNIYIFHENKSKTILQITDITKEKSLERHLKQKTRELELVTNVIDDFIFVIDSKGKIHQANKAWQRALGYKIDQVIGSHISKFLDPPSYNKIIKSFEDKSLLKKGNIIRTKTQKKDGGFETIEWNCSFYKDYIYAVGRDITNIIETQERILYLSYHDSLTGLYNRNFFEEELRRLNNTRNLPLSIIMGDVNGLKITNDVFGHYKGDKLLKDIAKILKNSIRKGDILARWGGDEFTILLPNTDEIVTEEIINRVYEACEKNDLTLNYASISLGYDIKTSEEQNIYTILANAENDMYKNKSKDGRKFREDIISYMTGYLKDGNLERKSSIEKVKDYLKKLSSHFNLNESYIDKLILLAELHDLGIVSVPKSILNKVEPLSESDWKEIKKHSETGFRIAKSIPEIAHIANYILYHHERYDGIGYPHGLKGKEIPLINRIFSVVDVYENLNQNKVYRSSFTKDEVINCLKVNKGKLFDPEIVDLFLDILKKEEKVADPVS